MSAIINVTAFLDWKAQIHNARTKSVTDLTNQAKLTLQQATRVISKTINDIGDEKRNRYQVTLRLYYGWHQGVSPTKSRIALMKLENDPDFSLARFATNVLFEPHYQYGETLLNALPHRLIAPAGKGMPRIHLPDTYRRPLGSSQPGREKMVDTALTCDLLVHARSDARDWRIVLAEDDDLVPALFVAEAWSKPQGGRTILIRNRGESRHLHLEGLIREYPR